MLSRNLVGAIQAALFPSLLVRFHLLLASLLFAINLGRIAGGGTGWSRRRAGWSRWGRHLCESGGAEDQRNRYDQEIRRHAIH
jgi:hypothetical protein